MSTSFLKKIIENKVDDSIHKKFVRYSKGQFQKEELKVKFGAKIQIWAGFEYLDSLFSMISDIVSDNVNIKGIILARQDITSELAEFKIEPSLVKKAKGFTKFQITTELSAQDFKKFVEKFNNNHYLLLTIKSGNIEIKTKTSLPKPGSLKEKFINVKLPKKYEELVRKEFCFDSSEKEVVIKHKYLIDDIEIPKEFENDPLKARLNAKRKGKLVVEINGKEKNYDLNV